MITTPTERERKMLTIVLSILAVVLAWRFVIPAIQEWVAGQNAQSQAARRVAETREITRKPVVPVRLEHLNAGAGAYEPNRNIFRYGQRKAVRQAPPPVVKRDPPPAPPPVRRDPPPPQKPRPPAIDFELMGIFGPENRRIAVLLDGKEIINALLNDVVKEQFIVNDIGLQSVEFRFVDFPADETARIEIGER